MNYLKISLKQTNTTFISTILSKLVNLRAYNVFIKAATI